MNLFRVAIVGAGSLKGKELKDVLEERRFPAVDIKLLDDDESLGQLEAVGDEATFIQSVRPEQFENVDFAFFASDEAFARENWRLAKQAGSAIVDLEEVLRGLDLLARAHVDVVNEPTQRRAHQIGRAHV